MIDCQKHLFELPEYISYINCAYMSPLLKTAAEAGQRAVAQKLRPYEIGASDFFDPVTQLRKTFAQLIQAPDYQSIAVIPSASYGLATVAHNLNLKPSDNFVVLEEQFPSNVYTWMKLANKTGAEMRTIKAPKGNNRTQNWNEKVLDAIDENTAFVSLCHCHWADGTLFDLKAIREKTHKNNTLLIIDGTQSVGALDFFISEFQPDALICAGYKWLMGPYSTGLAYYGPAFENGDPIEDNWIHRLNSENFAGLVDYEPNYQPGASRYSVGEVSNFMLLPILQEGLNQLLKWNQTDIQNYCKHISKNTLNQLLEMGCHLESEDQRAHHLFGIRLSEAFDLGALKKKFSENNVYVSFRGNAIRLSPHLYNTEKDFEKLLNCFQAVWKGKSHFIG